MEVHCVAVQLKTPEWSGAICVSDSIRAKGFLVKRINIENPFSLNSILHVVVRGTKESVKKLVIELQKKETVQFVGMTDDIPTPPCGGNDARSC